MVLARHPADEDDDGSEKFPVMPPVFKPGDKVVVFQGISF